MEIRIEMAAHICSKCGKPANVAATKVDLPAGPEDLVLFCESCALAGVREIPPCPWLTMVVSSTPGVRPTGQIRRGYEILALNKEANLAKIKIVGEDSHGTSEPILNIRYDTVPLRSREVGCTFWVTGVPLELSLLEGSAFPSSLDP